MGFDQKAVEAVGEDWPDIEEFNQTLERLRKRRLSSIRPEGVAAESKVVWKISSFIQVVLYRIVMLADGCADAWNARNVLAALLCSRAIMETSAVILDFEIQLKRFCGDSNFSAIDDLVMNRTFSTRQEDWHKEGSGLAAVSVLTLIDKMDKTIEGARQHYDFLSEMCHPNSMGHNFMFGKLDTQTAVVCLSDQAPFTRAFSDHVFGGFILIGIFELSLDRIDKLLPRVLELSNAARTRTPQH